MLPKTKIHKQHDGDCTIYAAMINKNCTDGICTCGYGYEYKYLNNGSWDHLFSKERLDAMKRKADRQRKKIGPNAEEDMIREVTKIFEDAKAKRK